MRKIKKGSTLYFTDNAFTSGIFKGKVLEFSSESNKLFIELENPTRSVYFSSKCSFFTKKEALANCEEKRNKKIAKLEKQISKLENNLLTADSLRKIHFLRNNLNKIKNLKFNMFKTKKDERFS